MSEFHGPRQEEVRAEDQETANGMNAFGKPVPYLRRHVAMAHWKEIGLDTNKSMATIDRMSEAIFRDEPYKAMEAGMAHLDLTGTYRLLAVLCTGE